jgi:hypothetical protein
MEPSTETSLTPSLYCKKCRSSILLLRGHSDLLKAEFASISRKDLVEGIEFAVARFALDYRESKRLVLHLSVEKEHCHRCNNLIFAKEFLCSCRSVTLDW